MPVIRDILKSNQIVGDSRHFEGKSTFDMSGGNPFLILYNFPPGYTLPDLITLASYSYKLDETT